VTTNPVEHLNRDIRRRTRVVDIFPNIESALRIITIRLIEETEDWSTERRYMDPSHSQRSRWQRCQVL